MKIRTESFSFLAVLALGACSDNSSQTPQFGAGTGATSGAAMGGSGSGNSTSTTGTNSGTGATSGAASTGSMTSSGSGASGGSTGVSTDAGSGASSGAVSDGGSGDASIGGADPITKVLKTAGCGMDPGQAAGATVRGTIQTMGTKPAGCADSACGPWSYLREYFVTLPMPYDKTKAYPLVLEGPGCGGGGMAVYPLNNNVNNTVIRVGLTPPPNAIGHATNPGQGCFDDKEGDSSVDWVFYENLYDKLAAVLCFDKNRVFSVGNSSGSWFSNELGCKYAGDPTRPVRGVMPNTGGLPTDPKYVPTCTTKGMAGMWIHEIGDTTNPFTGNKVAIARAMKVNGCTIGTGYDDTMFDPYPIGGGNPDGTCKKIRGCPDLYPLVVCPLPGNAHGSHDNVANPGFSTFITMFSTPPLLTP